MNENNLKSIENMANAVLHNVQNAKEDDERTFYAGYYLAIADILSELGLISDDGHTKMLITFSIAMLSQKGSE